MSDLDTFEAELRELVAALRSMTVMPRRLRARILAVLVTRLAERLFLT